MKPNIYWGEGVSEALDEVGIPTQNGQAYELASLIQGMHEVCGELTHGYATRDVSFHDKEIARLTKELDEERSKIPCDWCGGSGSVAILFGPWRSIQGCGKCDGKGRILPSQRKST